MVMNAFPYKCLSVHWIAAQLPVCQMIIGELNFISITLPPPNISDIYVTEVLTHL